MTRTEQRAHVQKWYTAIVGRRVSDCRLDWREKQKPEALDRAKVCIVVGLKGWQTGLENMHTGRKRRKP
ncbi:MAG TPA: hypothetical protein VF283_06165 [Bryobacteraceae bacterium]